MNWRLHIHNLSSNGPMGRFFTRSDSPAWVVWTSLTVAALVIVLPLIVLSLLAILVGVLLFFLLTVVATLLRLFDNALNWLKRLVTGRDEQGRRNVTVRPRDHSNFQ